MSWEKSWAHELHTERICHFRKDLLCPQIWGEPEAQPMTIMASSNWLFDQERHVKPTSPVRLTADDSILFIEVLFFSGRMRNLCSHCQCATSNWFSVLYIRIQPSEDPVANFNAKCFGANSIDSTDSLLSRNCALLFQIHGFLASGSTRSSQIFTVLSALQLASMAGPYIGWAQHTFHTDPVCPCNSAWSTHLPPSPLPHTLITLSEPHVCVFETKKDCYRPRSRTRKKKSTSYR